MAEKENTNKTDALGVLVHTAAEAGDSETLSALIMAEQACIDYYYDLVKTQAVKTMTSQGDITDIPTEPMQDAIRAINKACANQKQGYLFKGNINDRKDLFEFAKKIANIA